MSKTEIDVKERVQELIQMINTYREKLRSGPGDTSAAIKNWGFDVAKQDKDYTIGVELDLTLTPKPKRGEKNKK